MAIALAKDCGRCLLFMARADSDDLIAVSKRPPDRRHHDALAATMARKRRAVTISISRK